MVHQGTVGAHNEEMEMGWRRCEKVTGETAKVSKARFGYCQLGISAMAVCPNWKVQLFQQSNPITKSKIPCRHWTKLGVSKHHSIQTKRGLVKENDTTCKFRQQHCNFHRTADSHLKKKCVMAKQSEPIFNGVNHRHPRSVFTKATVNTFSFC